MTNVIQLSGGTLVVVPGHRTAFALSHSNRSMVDVFTLQPKQRSAEGLLAMLIDVLGSRAPLVRYVIVVDAPGLPGDRADSVNDAKAAAAALASACGAELRSIDWLLAKAIADEQGVDPALATSLVSAIEAERRKLAASGVKLGTVELALQRSRQFDRNQVEQMFHLISKTESGGTDVPPHSDQKELDALIRNAQEQVG